MLLPGTAIRISADRWWNGPWWEREALTAINRGWFNAIKGRHDHDLYLLRLWLTPPVPGSDERLESAESLLLHFFARGDDDGSLHDHPWDFRTTILAGWYVENLPPADWSPDSGLGPPCDAVRKMRSHGDEVDHRATDLHAVAKIAHGTWTLVRTGPRVRSWGFFPPGRPWMSHEDYLAPRPPQVA